MAIAEMYGAPFRLALAAQESDRRARREQFQMELAQVADQREREKFALAMENARRQNKMADFQMELARKNAPIMEQVAALEAKNKLTSAQNAADVNAFVLRDRALDPARKLRYGIPLAAKEQEAAVRRTGFIPAGPLSIPTFTVDPALTRPETEDDRQWIRGLRLMQHAEAQAAAKARGTRGIFAMDLKGQKAMLKNELLPHLEKYYGERSKEYLDGLTEQLAQFVNSEQYQSMTPQERAKVPAALVKNFWYRNASQKDRSEFEERETENRLAGLYLKQWDQSADDDRKAVKSAYSKYSTAAKTLEDDLASGEVKRGSKDHLTRLREIDEAWNEAKGIGKFKSPVYNELLHLEYDLTLKELQAAEAALMRDYPRWYGAVKDKYGDTAIGGLGGKFRYYDVYRSPAAYYVNRDPESRDFFDNFIPRLKEVQALRDALTAREGWIKQNEALIADGK